MKVSGSSSKKIGRNKVKCQRYKTEGRREKNRDKRMKEIIKNFEKASGNKYKIVKVQVNNPKTKIKIGIEILNIVRK